MIIRTATPEDSPAIAALWNPFIRDSSTTFNSREKSPGDVAGLITQRLNSGHAFEVAVSEGTVLGFATYSQFRGGLGYARTMEHTVVISPAAQGCGMGRRLMERIEEHARAAGVHSMFAGVSGENPDGISFHKKVGYREVAQLEQVGYKFGRWMDLHLLQKML